MSSTVLIRLRAPGQSFVNITNRVLFSSASIESQLNAIPGLFEVTLRDIDRDLDPPVTGSELTLDIDGVRLFGGYVTQVSRKLALPVDVLPTDARQWVLRGTDYNILLDKRVSRNPSNVKQKLPGFTGSDYDGDLIKALSQDYIDTPGGFDVTTEVDNVRRFGDTADPYDPDLAGGWGTPGSSWREQLERVVDWSGGVYYIDADKFLHHHAIEDVIAPFEFGDNPNGTTRIGVRNVVATEDASQMVNDALVWGGSEWTEGLVYARSTNSTSVSDHNRWQRAEVHLGEESYKVDTKWKADQIVYGSPEVLSAGFNPGFSEPQWNLTLTWFAEDVPGNDHIKAGQIVTCRFSTFGAGLNPIKLPMRKIRVSFIGVDENGKGHVQFEGQLGLQLDDPYSMWALLRWRSRTRRSTTSTATNATADQAEYGDFFQVDPIQITSTLYDLPGDMGYIAGYLMVYVDGVLVPKSAYTETSPVRGEFTFLSPPGGTVYAVGYAS